MKTRCTPGNRQPIKSCKQKENMCEGGEKGKRQENHFELQRNVRKKSGEYMNIYNCGNRSVAHQSISIISKT